MADKSAIEWTDATWTPIRARNRATGKVGWHCEHDTTGCVFCYAEGFNKRLGTGLPFKPGRRKDIDIFLDEEMLLAPLRWKKPRMIFVCSMTDLFADFVPDEWIIRVVSVCIAGWLLNNHTSQILTKRAGRMRTLFNSEAFWEEVNMAVADRVRHVYDPLTIDDFGPGNPCAGIWLGVSAERQQEADARIPELLATPAAVRFVSAEPLLGPIDFTHIRQAIGTSGSYTGCNALRAGSFNQWSDARLDWIIVGGESGPDARPMVLGWAKEVVRQCRSAGVSVFVKQLGAKPTNREGLPHPLKNKKGGDWSEWPEELRIREFPHGV